MNRRDFLKLMATSPIGFYLSGCSSGGINTTSASALEQLAASLAGKLILPDDSGFDALAFATNGRYRNNVPVAIAECINSQDIATAIMWARQVNVSFTPCCGGHNYAGYSTTTGLMISVRAMKDIYLDELTGIMMVGAGVQNRDVIAKLRGGNWVLPTGTCPSVGISGITLGGGLGYNSRWAGLTMDNLLDTTVILASGEILIAGESENQDLFWGLRGAAGRQFGINSSFTFQLKPVPRTEILVFGFEFVGIEALISGVQAWNRVMQTAPDTLSSVIQTRSDSDNQVSGLLFGQYIGTEADGKYLLSPVFAANPSDNYVKMLPWWEAQAFLTDGESIPDSFWDRNHFMSQPLTNEQIVTLINQLALFPQSAANYQGEITFYGWTGGVVNQVDAGVTAFVHRNTCGLVRFACQWEYNGMLDVPPVLSTWMENIWALGEAMLSPGCYQNFPDPELSDWQIAYYGQNLSKLIALKRHYDPNNVFSFQQSIPLI